MKLRLRYPRIRKQEGKSFSSDESCFQWIEEKQWVEKKSDWITVIQNYNKIKNYTRGKIQK